MIRFLTHLSALYFILLTISSQAFAQTPDRGGDNPVIVRAGYDFAPTLMLDLNANYKTWWCSGNLSANPPEVDVIRYSTSTSLNGPWSSPIGVFSESNLNKFDRDSVCSPSIILVEGIYYMFYEGAKFDSNGILIGIGTAIGVAQSTNGLNWTRLNNGNPIITAHNWSAGLYGAGYPSVTRVNGYFYMLYYDDTGIDQSKRSYVLRSPNPLFPVGQTEQLGASGFEPYNPNTNTQHGIRDVVNADLMYHHGLSEFQLGITGITGLVSTAFFDRSLLTELRLTHVNGTWKPGPRICKG